MSMEVFPIVEGYAEAEFFDVAEWRNLARCLDALDAAALQQRITPLRSFLSYTRAEALESLGDEAVFALENMGALHDGTWFHGEQMLWSLQERWFSAGAGLGCVAALIEYSKSHPEHFDDKFLATEAVSLLSALRTVLMQAQVEGKRFHLKTTT